MARLEMRLVRFGLFMVVSFGAVCAPAVLSAGEETNTSVFRRFPVNRE
jgi:hypothetical protein